MSSETYRTGDPDDPDRIRRDIERTQANLSADVEAFTEKVSPGRIVSRRVDRIRGTAGRWKDNVMGSDPRYGTRRAHVVTGTHSSGGPGPVQQAAGRVSDMGSSVSDTVSGAASSVADTVQDAPYTIRRQTRGNPLAAGLIAFGAGWLVSSLVPASSQEQQLAEQARDRAGDLARPLAEAAGEVRDNLADPAREAADSVRSTATDAGRTVVEEGRQQARQ